MVTRCDRAGLGCIEVAALPRAGRGGRDHRRPKRWRGVSGGGHGDIGPAENLGLGPPERERVEVIREAQRGLGVTADQPPVGGPQLVERLRQFLRPPPFLGTGESSAARSARLRAH